MQPAQSPISNVVRLTDVGEFVHDVRPLKMVPLPQVFPKGMVANALSDASRRIKLAFDMRHKHLAVFSLAPQSLLTMSTLFAVTVEPKSTWNHSDNPCVVWEKVVLSPSTPLEAAKAFNVLD